MNKDIIICGVGGQGTVLASKIIAASAMRNGETVHSAETIGMAQRGGPVTSHVRIGESAFSPLIPDGHADLLLAFEPAEAVRNLHFLAKGGTVFVNSSPVKPTTESLRDTGYDGTEMIAYLKSKCRTVAISGDSVCARFGSSKFFNIIILGAACGSGCLGIPEETILTEMEARIKPKFLEKNKEAFAAGLKIGRESLGELG